MIFWEHVKGLKGTNAYTYINFQTWTEGSTAMWQNPSISKVANETGNYILTSGMTGGYISEDFTFKNRLTLENGNNDIIWEFDSNKWKITTSQTLSLLNAIDITNSSVNISQNTTITGSTSLTGASANQLSISAGNSLDGSCTAVYFNATSDYRAKKDFHLLDINALDLIKKIQLYSFKYKESNMPSIGIIAQDVQDININGFKLVDNENATGDNLDYMTIHESKLVYILWKAIQEQQKEIEELKKLLNK